MAIEWDVLRKRHKQLSDSLANNQLDRAEREKLQKEYAQLDSLLLKHTEIHDIQAVLDDARKQVQQETDSEMAQLFEQEVHDLEQALSKLQKELDDLLYPPYEHDNRSVFLEIRSGAGGQEAALFVADLLKMYSNYAAKMGWRATVEDSSATDLGGFREVVLYIQGKGVYGHLKHESGVHRVQRVPETETSGRVHTSTATVAVLPEAKEVDILINPSDLRVDVFRASGAGGQHVNTTDSAVRITHEPTGVVVSCQDERSQHKNKAKALKILKSRILAHEVEKQQQHERSQRKQQVGAGMRAEKVRTYNFPQNRVTDHQVNVTLKKLDMVMEGDIDVIIQALQEKDRQERRDRAIVGGVG